LYSFLAEHRFLFLRSNFSADPFPAFLLKALRPSPSHICQEFNNFINTPVILFFFSPSYDVSFNNSASISVSSAALLLIDKRRGPFIFADLSWVPTMFFQLSRPHSPSFLSNFLPPHFLQFPFYWFVEQQNLKTAK